MCGLAGFVRPPGDHSWDPVAGLEKMGASLSHRGPDDQGTWVDPESGVYLGFRRLSILDLSPAGHQPMVSASGRFVITFNGEVYNFASLREELSSLGFVFRSGSDTEVILAAVERWGFERAVPRFRGMFALAVWDSRDRVLWLGRDRMGIKPLFVYERAGGLAFASEARAFHACPFFEGRGCVRAAREFLLRMYVPAPASILSGVTKVAPGALLKYRVDAHGATRVASTQYWDMPTVASRGASRPVLDDGAAIDELEELLRASIRLRLVADVPVGALLSGGVDSTLVVALMQSLSDRPVRTFTIGFDNPDFDEGPTASRVAKFLGTDHTPVAFSTSDLIDLVPGLPGTCDEPMANPSLLPTILVCRAARESVVVALTGDGGDELFGGYNRYVHGARLIGAAQRLPGGLRRVGASLLDTGAGGAIARGLQGAFRPSSFGNQQSSAERLAKVVRVLRARDARDAYDGLMITDGALPALRAARAEAIPGNAAWDGATLEERMMLHDQMKYLPDDLLTKVDRASMWTSLEARVPILDHEVVEFSWRLRLDQKIHGGVAKWPLREVARRYLPEDVLERPKMGFTVPIAEWLQSDLRTWARDTLNTSDTLWNRVALDDLWARFETGQSDLALPLWTASVLQSWSDGWGVTFG